MAAVLGTASPHSATAAGSAQNPNRAAANPDARLGIKPLAPVTIAPHYRSGIAPHTTNLIAFPGFDNSVLPGGGPADPSVAAGPSDLVETVNESMGIFAKTSGVQFSTTLQSWFGRTGSIFDPHTLRDPISGHYIVIADDNKTQLDMSVSTSSTSAFTNWCNFFFTATNTAGQFADFPMIGMDTRNIYVTFNEFNGAGTQFQGNRIIIISRTAVENCQSPAVSFFANLGDPGAGSPSSSIVPATNDHSVEPQAFFINNYPGGGSNVISRYFGTDNLMHSYQVSVPAYSEPPITAKQESISALLDPGDGRIVQAIQFNFGLYAAFSYNCTNLGGTNVDCVEWLKINDGPYPSSLTAAGAFGLPNDFYIYPAMGQGADGTAMITATFTGPAVHPQPVDVTINLNGNITGDVYLLNGPGGTYDGVKSSRCATCYRWGDFASVYNDPTNMNQFWVADQTTGNGATNWGTVLGHVGE